jgi:hypothetical protein
MSIQLFGFWRSIASFRVRVALRLKNLPFEETSVDILSGEQFKPGYDAVNPEHVVPTFIHDGHSLFQSMSIMIWVLFRLWPVLRSAASRCLSFRPRIRSSSPGTKPRSRSIEDRLRSLEPTVLD